jgi:aminoglycoside 6-adenylyltransferase
MPLPDDIYMDFEAHFLRWAKSRHDIRLILVCGSRARHEQPADGWSDLDLVMFTADPDKYTAGRGWMALLGEVWAATLMPAGPYEEWLIVLKGGLDVDILLVPVAAALKAQHVREALPESILARGVRPLLDRDAIFPQLMLPPRQPAPLPDEATYLNLVHRFWRYALRTAKKLRRGELWVAHDLCDNQLKQEILTLAAWYAGPEADTWHDGRFFEAWADPRIQEALRTAFAAYDAEDVWRALQETVSLFSWVAQAAADRLGYTYPAGVEAPIRGEIDRLYAARATR